MTSRGAYTLIEILIVLALLSLILAIAIPGLGIFSSIKETQELNELKRDLLNLRNKAITENCFYDLRIDINQNRYRLGVNTHQSSVKLKALSSGLKFISATKASAASDAVFVFSPSGSPSISGNFVIQKRNGHKYKFKLAVASGKINIELIK